jgi:hypothetical protein
MKKGGLLLHGKKDKKFNTAVVSIISRPGRSGQFLQREITRPPNLTALGISLILSHHPLSTDIHHQLVRDFSLHFYTSHCHKSPRPSFKSDPERSTYLNAGYSIML